MKCHYCGEQRYNALRELDCKIVCYNCSDYSKRHKILYCIFCKSDLPCEMHHILGRKYPYTIPLCCNCHRVHTAELRLFDTGLPVSSIGLALIIAQLRSIT